jgi:hypothetical protein
MAMRPPPKLISPSKSAGGVAAMGFFVHPAAKAFSEMATLKTASSTPQKTVLTIRIRISPHVSRPRAFSNCILARELDISFTTTDLGQPKPTVKLEISIDHFDEAWSSGELVRALIHRFVVSVWLCGKSASHIERLLRFEVRLLVR